MMRPTNSRGRKNEAISSLTLPDASSTLPSTRRARSSQLSWPQAIVFAALCSGCTLAISNFFAVNINNGYSLLTWDISDRRTSINETPPATEHAAPVRSIPRLSELPNEKKRVELTPKGNKYHELTYRKDMVEKVMRDDPYARDDDFPFEDFPVHNDKPRWPEINITEYDPSIQVIRNGIDHPNVAWLMSFPNSGTSFTIHMTREAANVTTATNYAMEGDIRDKPSVQVIHGKLGENGPFLELIQNRYTNMPATILTKTHCTGYCSHCGPRKLLLETPRTFARGCLTGTRAVETSNGLESVDVMYDHRLVKKAIHLFRHPLDNIVARFHLEFNEQKAANNTYFLEWYPKNAEGFRGWCRHSDHNKDLLETRYIDEDLHIHLKKIPCLNEFFKYVQWHNMAFYTSHDLQIETMIMHYHEYSEDFEKARDKVLGFLELPLVGTGIEFHDGKVYRHYYTREQKIAIRAFIQEFATPDTWQQLKDYDFEIDAEPAAIQ